MSRDAERIRRDSRRSSRVPEAIRRPSEPIRRTSSGHESGSTRRWRASCPSEAGVMSTFIAIDAGSVASHRFVGAGVTEWVRSAGP